jgi:hypothetical protein
LRSISYSNSATDAGEEGQACPFMTFVSLEAATTAIGEGVIVVIHLKACTSTHIIIIYGQ